MATQEQIAELTAMQKIVYDAVTEILDMKRVEVEPCVAHINEVRNLVNIELTEALRDLCRRGLLSFSIDINKHPMFYIKQQ